MLVDNVVLSVIKKLKQHKNVFVNINIYNENSINKQNKAPGEDQTHFTEVDAYFKSAR